MDTSIRAIIVLLVLVGVVQCFGRESRKSKSLCGAAGCGIGKILIIVLAVVCIGSILLACFIFLFIRYYRRNGSYCTENRSNQSGASTQNNVQFIATEPVKVVKTINEPFQTGIWSYRYYQYGKWHGPFRLTLTFNSSSNEVTGRGVDNVGDFTIDGVFSPDTLRLGLTQQYKEGTGDPNENLGHVSTIQMTWHSSTNQFEGIWYVQTHKYSGNGKLELRFQHDSEPLLDAATAC